MNTQDQASTVESVSYDAEMEAYLNAGEAKAFALGNRGPIRFEEDGAVHRDILEAYWRCGFYVFEGVFDADELADIEADFKDVLDRLPTEQGSPVDAKGRPAIGADSKAPSLRWSKPLGDPTGGTDHVNGRHPVKMIEPTAAADAPDEIVFLMLGTLQHSEACLRAYAHPGLLAVAAAVNGDDFVPFTDAFFIKEPGLGASVAWHQDGTTLWDRDDWDEGSHGFNFMAQLYGCTPANGVWVVPGSHKLGKIDIAAAVAEAGSERLPDAVPIVCAPGDVAITNRQTLHGSFANTSEDWRVTVNFGFLRRRSIIGEHGWKQYGGKDEYGAKGVYDEAQIRERSRVIGYAIDARRQSFPDETPYVYEPFLDSGDEYAWNEAAKADLKDYNLFDMRI